MYPNSLHYKVHNLLLCLPKFLPSSSLYAMDPSHPSNEASNLENTNNNTNSSSTDNHAEFDEDYLAQGLEGVMELLATFSEMDNDLIQQNNVAPANNNDISAFMEDYLRSVPNIETEAGAYLRDIRRSVTDRVTEVMVNTNNRDPRAIFVNNRRVNWAASESAIQGLEKVSVIVEEKDENGKSNECSICFEDFSNDNQASRMPCSHLFHTRCIYGWLHTRNTCPLCRFELPTGDDAN